MVLWITKICRFRRLKEHSFLGFSFPYHCGLFTFVRKSFEKITTKITITQIFQPGHFSPGQVTPGYFKPAPVNPRHFKSGNISPRTLNVICRFCNKQFNDTSAVKRHELIHTGEKPYSCDFCHKRFNDSSTLKGHIRTHTG